MQSKLKKEIKGIKLIIKDSSPEALIALSTGEADAYVGNLIISSHHIQKRGLFNIKVASPTSFGLHSQAMATRKEWSPLISIINKGLGNLSEDQKVD